MAGLAAAAGTAPPAAAALRGVLLSRRAYGALMAQALTTDREEVLALLLGDFGGGAEGEPGKVARVWAIAPQRRAERREDRVEVDAPSLADAAARAEALGCRVVGWFHSHPRITVQPSWQDVATQQLYQSMEPAFVALIASVFNTVDHPAARAAGSEAAAIGVVGGAADGGATAGRVHLICFASDSSGGHREVQVRVAEDVEVEPEGAPFAPCLSAVARNALEEEMHAAGNGSAQPASEGRNAGGPNAAARLHRAGELSAALLRAGEGVVAPAAAALSIEATAQRARNASEDP